jgi:hypothetical protein
MRKRKLKMGTQSKIKLLKLNNILQQSNVVNYNCNFSEPVHILQRTPESGKAATPLANNLQRSLPLCENIDFAIYAPMSGIFPCTVPVCPHCAFCTLHPFFNLRRAFQNTSGKMRPLLPQMERLQI